ncbi:MAG: thioredoxin family protein [Akkermansia sp.]|nr:thioredoxin family protein [Akkermansia sp.]
MNMGFYSKCLLCVGLVLSAVSGAVEPVWRADLPAALAQAGREDKHVLVDFTGSDWCSACIRLRRNILDSKEFMQWAGKQFVFVEVDIPQKPVLPAEQLAENKAVAEAYGVSGFPTIMVLNARGQVTGGFLGDVGQVDAAVAHLERALRVSAMFEQAEELSGEEKARVLMAAYRLFPGGKAFERHRDKLEADILKHDPDNATGMKDILEVRSQAVLFEAERESVSRFSAEYGQLIERQLAEALEPNRAGVLMAKCQYALGTARTVDDLEQAKKLLEQVIRLQNPDEAKETQAYLERFFADLPALLRMLEQNCP